MTRFPTYPKDILSRADALLSEKYPDGIVDPRFVEIACEAMMAEREIPEDIRNTAYAMVMRLVDRDRDSGENAEVIAEAIVAERERCAKLIEEGFEKAVGESYELGHKSKNDKCPHGRYMYEDCDQCCADAIRAPGIPS